MVSLWKTILVIAIMDCIHYDIYIVFGALNQSCVPADNISCSVCCAGNICYSSYFPNHCTNGCIDGHRGVRCYELCTYNCKKCDNNMDICESCFDEFYLGVNKDCKSKCLPTCKKCSSGNSCISCKDAFYNKNGSTDCRYPVCPTNCVCNDSECVTCKAGFFDTSKFCTSKCSDNCLECSSLSKCSLCKNGFYNDNLQGKTCSSSCRDTCTICSTYDECLQCQQGRFGKQCQNICSSGCTNNVCEIETGQCNCFNNFSGERCTDCVPGKFGIDCKKKCPDNCSKGICGKILGDCSEGCKSDTITGTYCDKCVAGKYGLSCDDICPEKCLNNVCNKDNGTCTEGCNEGFDGPNCSECIQGKYGQECGNDCPGTCKNNECEKQNGHCFNCTGQFEGYKCGFCKQGFYGSDCDKKCSPKCLNVSCDKDTGNCTHGCITTYSGDKCCIRGMDCIVCANNTTCQECSPVYFGETCNKTCSDLCINNVCEIGTGICTQGCIVYLNKGICVRNQGNSEDVIKNDSNDTTIAVLATLFTVSTFALFTLILVMTIRHVRSSKRKHEESMHLSKLTELQYTPKREEVGGSANAPYETLDGMRLATDDHLYEQRNVHELDNQNTATYINM